MTGFSWVDCRKSKFLSVTPTISMATTYLKSGKPETERAEDDTKVRGIVESTLADIAARGDEAVRELSVKFDQYDPPSYRLSHSEIEEAMAKVPARDLADI